MAILDQAQLGGVTYDLQDTKAQAMIAPAFSAAQAYSAGDSVTYNGTLYTFTADHAAGAWIGTDAAAVPGGVTGEVADLKSAFDSIAIISPNIFNADDALEGYYNNSKELAPTDTTQTIPLKHVNIPVSIGDTVRFSVDSLVSVYNIGNLLDANLTPLFIIRNGSAYASYTKNDAYYEVTVLNASVAYLAITFPVNNSTAFMITKNSAYPSEYIAFGIFINADAIPDDSIEPEKTTFAEEIEAIPTLEEQCIQSFTPEMTTGKYITITDGSESNLATGSSSDYLDLEDVTDVYTALTLNVSIYYYNDKKQPIDGFDDTDGVAKWYSLTPPKGAKYVRISNRTNILDNNSVVCVSKIRKSLNYLSDSVDNVVETLGNVSNILGMYDKVICFGDSLTYSQVYFGTGNSDQRQAFSTYPQILAKLSGIESAQYAVPGDTPETWWERYYGTAFADNGLYIVFLGTNGGLTDTIETDCPGTDISNYANTATGYYGRILQSIKNTGNSAVLIKIFGGGGDSKETTNDVIEQFGTRYGFPVIDVESPDRTDRNYHYYPNKTGYNALHFNDLGYAWLANIVKQRINNLSTDDKFLIMRRQE